MEKATDQEDENGIGALGDLNWILALNHMIRILDYREFERFLGEERPDTDGSLFEGFLFLAKTISRSLLEHVSRSWSLNFPDDFAFSRACNRGVPLSKIKNYSLRVVFVKNLHKCLKEWWTSRDKVEIQARYEKVCQSIVKPLEKILESNLCLRKEYEKYGKEEVVRRLAILFAFISLNDTNRGHPKGYFFSLSKPNLSKQYLSRVFEGYKLSLAFVWRQLLKGGGKSEGRLLYRLAQSKDWHRLDSLFEPIRERIINPLEKEFVLGFGFGNYFQVRTPIDPKGFGKNLYEIPPEPALSKEEDLQQALFWYPVQAMKGSYIFNGVAAFTAFLAGTVTMKRIFGIEEKSNVVRFVHPVAEGKNDYSYAVLIEALGTISDYSGWLVFFDCAGDYSGFAGAEHKHAEMVIDRYRRIDAIELTEYVIDSKALLNYLTVFSAELTETYDPFISKIPVDGEIKKHKEILKETSPSARMKRFEVELASARGLLLELLSYYFFVSKGCATKWRYKNSKVIGEDEIDIVARDGSGNLYLVSCMASFDLVKARKLAGQAERFAVARRLLRQDFGIFKQVRRVIFLSKDLDSMERRSARGLKVQFFSLQRIFMENSPFSKAQKSQAETLFRLSQEMRYGPPWFM